MHEYIEGIKAVYSQHANPERAAGAKAYLRNQFEFYGLSMPVRRQVSKAYMKAHALPPYASLPALVDTLYALPQREFHYFGIELVAAYKKQWEERIIDVIEKMVVTNSWWDTVDYIASELSAPYFKRFPAQIKTVTGAWNRSENFWLQRSSLLFQKNYKAALDKDLLTAYILHLASSKEFFIQKAIGWVLREHSRHDPKWVKAFVEKHQLPPLSKREALKTISRNTAGQ
jgi:3-methyladenine DNA glycosylase AlkD